MWACLGESSLFRGQLLYVRNVGVRAVYKVDDEDKMMTPGEVAELFRVDPKTVTRWATGGRLASIKTPGGHRRFRTKVVMEYLRRNGRDGINPAELDDETATGVRS
jgi:excisionase family DNA binding protein